VNRTRIDPILPAPVFGSINLLTLIQSRSMLKCVFLLMAASAIMLSAASLDKKDVEYANRGGKPLLLDLHIPDGPGPFAAAILVHGGGFDAGSKSTNVRPLFEPLSNAGIAWFSLDYRLAPEAQFPQVIQDIDDGIAWVRRTLRRTGSTDRKS
jgi:acetyl esterase